VKAIAAQDAPAAHLGLWSFTALALAVAGVVLSVAVALEDPGGVRWWLVVAPVAITAFPMVVRTNAARLLAALLLTAWCVVGLASIGMFLLPALVAQFGAWIRERS
jgi:hypothetical protein